MKGLNEILFPVDGTVAKNFGVTILGKAIYYLHKLKW